jgi:primosomal protein N' (replication factor Y)
MGFTTEQRGLYAGVLLPLPLPEIYTYGVPVEFHETISIGLRVEVPFNKKLYSGIVTHLTNIKPVVKTRNIISFLDEGPIVSERQLEFWQWLSSYYCAHPGEVMNVALPAGLKLSSETKLMLNHGIEWQEAELSDQEYLVCEALSIQQVLTIKVIQEILNKKSVYPIIKSLVQNRLVVVQEELITKYTKKKEAFVRILEPYDSVELALELTQRSQKQSNALLALYSLRQKMKEVPKKAVYEMANVDSAVISALAKKRVVEIYQREVSRLDILDLPVEQNVQPLSEQQSGALEQIEAAFSKNKPVLLHGVTGSGKTRVFIELIKEVLDSGGQVLYLLPEIALTGQIVQRLQNQLGDRILVFHSQVKDAKRVEVFNAARFDKKLFIGARSSLFLPFENLKLIIVDEEHDGSYKQDHPNPKYQGRDVALVLGRMHQAKVILGTATPSLESYHNSIQGKYAYVQMPERFGSAGLPFIQVVDLKEGYKKGLVKNGISQDLKEAIESTIEQGQQVILFQNRRGFAPTIKCIQCGWTAECVNCDVTLTYHQKINELKCHYCGHRVYKKDTCPACGSYELQLMGAGTEKIEQVIGELFPDLKVDRFDHDTTRSKKNQFKLLEDFKQGRINILIGTQMITKGFDFGNIGLVGVLNADSLLAYPDFRASERSYQLLKQVSGRAGRRDKKGRVIIQAFQIDHPVIQELLKNDDERFYSRELAERKQFMYPPYYGMISVWFRHIEFQRTKGAAQYFYQEIHKKLGDRCTRPFDPVIIRVRNKYQQQINIKTEKDAKTIKVIKEILLATKGLMKTHKDFKRVMISIDIDPQ